MDLVEAFRLRILSSFHTESFLYESSFFFLSFLSLVVDQRNERGKKSFHLSFTYTETSGAVIRELLVSKALSFPIKRGTGFEPYEWLDWMPKTKITSCLLALNIEVLFILLIRRRIGLLECNEVLITQSRFGRHKTIGNCFHVGLGKIIPLSKPFWKSNWLKSWKTKCMSRRKVLTSIIPWTAASLLRESDLTSQGNRISHSSDSLKSGSL